MVRDFSLRYGGGKMKKNKLPDNRLDIITPVLDRALDLNKPVQGMRELLEIRNHEQESRQETKLYLIMKKTPLPARKAAEIIAYYFRREFHYDGPAYVANDNGDVRDRLFLFIQEEDWETHSVVGAIGFRWEKYTDAPEQLVLSWVWIHPFLRRQGILTTYWDLFKKLYGDFRVQPPRSPAMEAFLEKQRQQG